MSKSIHHKPDRNAPRPGDRVQALPGSTPWLWGCRFGTVKALGRKRHAGMILIQWDGVRRMGLEWENAATIATG